MKLSKSFRRRLTEKRAAYDTNYPKKRKEIFLITEIKKVDLFFNYDRDCHNWFDNMVLRKVVNGTLGKIFVFLLVKNI